MALLNSKMRTGVQFAFKLLISKLFFPLAIII